MADETPPGTALPLEHPVDTGDQPTEELRTLFLTGLPPDVRDREIYLAFRTCPGYEGCSLKLSAKLPICFVVFSDQSSALMAKDAMNGVQFDPDSPHTVLRIELAKQNSRITPSNKRSMDSGYGGGGEDKRARAYDPYSYANSYAQAPPSAYDPSLYSGMMYQQMGGGAPQGYPAAAVPSSGSGNSPCNTLFIANLGSLTTEQEMRELFQSFPGLKRMKLNQGKSGLVAFVEWENEAYATSAMTSCQGYTMPGSDKIGGMRIDYAKSAMGGSSRPPPMGMPAY